MRTLLATCSTQPIASAGNEFRLLPAGLFAAIDGRPHGLPGWRLTGETALSIIKLAAARVSDFVIDYEHQTLNTGNNGQPAPAAGWFKRLEWRAGDGLYVTDARWTERATTMIKAKEYRFISPTFHYEKDGRVLDIINAALTNNPALDGLTELAAASRRLASNATGAEIARAALAYQEAMADTGVNISTVQAVAHISPLASAVSTTPQLAAGKPDEIASAALAYQEKMGDLGVHVTTVQAVAHVSEKSQLSRKDLP